MKLGILGTGKIVQELLQVYAGLPVEKTYLLATERSREKAAQMAQTYGLDGVFTDYDALLAGDIDTVYVALPNHLHFAYTKKALERGKDVILEKPAASNLRELETLFAIAQQRGRILIEAMTVHHLPGIALLKEALTGIGEVKLASLCYCQYSSRYDDFRMGKIHPVFDPEKSGGALYDLNVYNLHAALALFGMPRSVRYDANVERGIDVGGVLLLDYGSFKVVCTGAKDCAGDNVSVIQGTAGLLRIREPLSRLTGFTLRQNDGSETYVPAGNDHRMYAEFVSLLRILGERDLTQTARCRDLSLAAAAYMEQARQQAGIRFACDG